ncbi:MAG: LapA family protein [Cyanobacteria bacterium J06633_8]
MQLINLVVAFIVCLALAFFSIENPEVAKVQFIPGVDIQAPVSIEFIFAMGLGALLASMFGAWTSLQQFFTSGGKLRNKNKRIQELESQVEQYKAEIESSQAILPPEETKATIVDS